MQKKQILITGGSGLLGLKLSEVLLSHDYGVSHLSRSAGKDARIKTFLWDVEKGSIDENCINDIDIVIHLAGAGIADKRWTDKRKKLLIDSRTQSIQLIYGLLKKKVHQVSHIISASATGYYSDRGEELLTEDSPPANDFLGNCCIAWEKAVDEGKALGLLVTKFRTGVVLTPKGGALPPLSLPIKLGAGTALGSGKQYTPWIHIDDVVAMYLYAIEGKCKPDVYIMAAPNPVTNKQLTQAIAKQLRRPLWLPNVPALLLRLALGEMSLMVLASDRISAEKIQQAGFRFRYPVIEDALKEIYG